MNRSLLLPSLTLLLAACGSESPPAPEPEPAARAGSDAAQAGPARPLPHPNDTELLDTIQQPIQRARDLEAQMQKDGENAMKAADAMVLPAEAEETPAEGGN